MNEWVKREYERLRKLFDGSDENQLAAIDGALVEAAKLRWQLKRLNDIEEQSGLVRVDKNNPMHQKELPVSRMITRVSANYLSYTTRIANALGKSIPDEEDDDFEREYG